MAAANESKKETKYWCLTVFCNDNVRHDYYSHPCTLDPITTGKGAEVEVTFICGQEEMCPTTGSWHKHVYIEFKNKVKFTTLKNKYPELHIESRKGTAEEARHYAQKDMDCEKFPSKQGELRNDDGQRFSFGTISDTKPGKRTDLENAITDIRAGMKRKDLAEKHGSTVVKYHKGLETLARWARIDLEDEDFDQFQERDCYIWFGVAGCGKSLAAKHIMGDDYFNLDYYKPQKNNAGLYSFENYMDQKWILLEEFNGKQMGDDILKEMMEPGRVMLPGRGSGSSVLGRHTGVIITSNKDPETWYDKPTDNYKVHWDAIQRRCRTVWSCGNLETGETDIWTNVGGVQKNGQPTPHTQSPSPLVSLQQWIDGEKAKRRAARAQSSTSTTSAAAQDADTSVEYSSISQASQVIDLSQLDD